MSNAKCNKCGVTYNPRTVEECPMCRPKLRYLKRNEVDTFLKKDCYEKAKIANSQRRSSLAIKQTQKLGHKMLQQFRGWH